jgi:hypothetical protein
MRPLTASQLLSLWEYGLTQPPWQRALSLLAAALPDSNPDTLVNLPVGQRDSQLLTLREYVFGPHLTSLATCPSCNELLELNFNVADIRAENSSDPSEAEENNPDEALSLVMGDYRMTFRNPNSLDLGEITSMSTPEQARLCLLERCLLSAEENEETRTAAELPDRVTSAIAERMTYADPQGDVQITLICPACAHQWQTAFDILSFFWIEINAWARRILREIHILASVYNWSEREILALSPQRRQSYLQIVTG